METIILRKSIEGTPEQLATYIAAEHREAVEALVADMRTDLYNQCRSFMTMWENVVCSNADREVIIENIGKIVAGEVLKFQTSKAEWKPAD